MVIPLNSPFCSNLCNSENKQWEMHHDLICHYILQVQLHNATQKARGGGMIFPAWVYLSLPSPSLLYSTSPMHRLYHLHILIYFYFFVFIFIYIYIFFVLPTPAAQEHFPTGHWTLTHHCIRYHMVWPIPVSVICSPYVYVIYVCMLVRCISV